MLGLFDPCISRKEQRQDITPDLLAHYRKKVITMVPYTKAHSKGKVHKNRQNLKETQPSEFSINGTTEKQHIPDLGEAFSQENGGF